MRTPPSAPRKATIDLLDPRVLAQIGQLELVSQRLVDGLMSGMHRSTHRGGAGEFAEHRPYAEGDEPRHIDWRMLARRDRYYVKQFESETNLQAWLVVDASGSMGFFRSTLSKFDCARIASACLGRMYLRQRDAVGLAMSTAERDYFIPARPQANHFQSVVQTLQFAQAGGRRSVVHALAELARRVKRRGMVLVFSDCFGALDELTDSLHRLRTHGHDVIVFHVLAPEEIEFPFRTASQFCNLEMVNQRIDLDPSSIRRQYLARFQRFQAELALNLGQAGCELVQLTTNSDLGATLALFLRRRMSKVSRG